MVLGKAEEVVGQSRDNQDVRGIGKRQWRLIVREWS